MEDNSKEIETSLKKNLKNIDNEKEDSESYFSQSSDNLESDYETADSDVDQSRTKDLSTKFSKLNCESTEFVVHDKNNMEHNADDILVPVNEINSDEKDGYEDYDDDDDGDSSEGENEDEDDNDDDDTGWITPSRTFAIFHV